MKLQNKAFRKLVVENTLSVNKKALSRIAYSFFKNIKKIRQRAFNI